MGSMGQRRGGGKLERSRPVEHVAHPPPGLEVGVAFAGLDLSVLTNGDSDQPGGPAFTESFALPTALHHRRERGERWHGSSLSRPPDCRMRALAVPLNRGPA